MNPKEFEEAFRRLLLQLRLFRSPSSLMVPLLDDAEEALTALKSGKLVVMSGEEYQLLKQYKENREKRIKNCPIVNQAIEHGKRKDDE